MHFSSASQASFLTLALSSTVFAQSPLAPPRKVLEGISTQRQVFGVPYSLAGKRIAFTNWHYVQPGDLDWRSGDKSVYVSGNSAPLEARHIGIRAPHGIRIMAEKPQIVGPMDRPHRMIVKDGETYKAWTDSDYYESTDAMHWQKKAALKLDGVLDDSLYQVFIDPSAPTSERYKAVGSGHLTRAQFDAFRKQRPDGWEPRAVVHLAEKDHVACLRGCVSADGIRWTSLPDPLVVEYCDTWNTAYYDSELREYVIYTRYWSIGPRSEKLPPDIRNSWTGFGRRAIGRTASPDFSRFAPSEMILEPTPDMRPSEQLYTNCYTTIPGAPDQHLMFPSIWNGSVDDTTRIALASSHDGKLWHWVPGGDQLRTQGFGQWNGGCIWATPNLIELPSGDWALPYLAHSLPHKYPRGQQVGSMGYAIWPKGRLVAIEAEDDGEFTMQPIIAPGKTLKINALTGRAGWIKVEVVGVNGHSLSDCQPIVGDKFWTNVAWKDTAESGIVAGQPTTLRIELKQAKLYGLDFE